MLIENEVHDFIVKEDILLFSKNEALTLRKQHLNRILMIFIKKMKFNRFENAANT